MSSIAFFVIVGILGIVLLLVCTWEPSKPWKRSKPWQRKSKKVLPSQRILREQCAAKNYVVVLGELTKEERHEFLPAINRFLSELLTLQTYANEWGGAFKIILTRAPTYSAPILHNSPKGHVTLTIHWVDMNRKLIEQYLALASQLNLCLYEFSQWEGLTWCYRGTPEQVKTDFKMKRMRTIVASLRALLDDSLYASYSIRLIFDPVSSPACAIIPTLKTISYQLWPAKQTEVLDEFYVALHRPLP